MFKRALARRGKTIIRYRLHSSSTDQLSYWSSILEIGACNESEAHESSRLGMHALLHVPLEESLIKWHWAPPRGATVFKRVLEERAGVNKLHRRHSLRTHLVSQLNRVVLSRIFDDSSIVKVASPQRVL